MKVCDRHRDRHARETLHVINDDTFIDLCAECKTEVLMLLASEPETKAAPPPKHSTPIVETPAPKRGFFTRGN